jgi:hypothetical protein
MSNKKEDMEYIKRKISNEGFEYSFVNYSDFKEVEDEEFHKLRTKFLKAREELLNYVIKESK